MKKVVKGIVTVLVSMITLGLLLAAVMGLACLLKWLWVALV